MPLDTRFISIDPRQIAEVTALTSGFGNKFNVAMQAAISRTLDPTAKKMFSDRVKDTINLPVAEIKRQVTVKKPSFTRLVGTITMSRKPVPLIRYLGTAGFKRAQTLRSKVKGNQTRFRRFRVSGGISVKVRKDRSAERYPSAFVNAASKGYIGIFHRIRNKGGASAAARQAALSQIQGLRGGKFKVSKKVQKQILFGGMYVKRYPLRSMQGPTAVGVLAHAPGKNAATILDEIQVALGPILQKNVDQQIQRLITAPQTFSAFKGYAEH
jgi:hypothetical protein